MSSSPTSSSSSDAAATDATTRPFAGFLDVVCDLSVTLWTGTIRVRDCLALQRNSVLRLDQSAGEDLVVHVNGATVARGEVVIVEDSTAIRVTEIPLTSGGED